MIDWLVCRSVDWNTWMVDWLIYWRVTPTRRKWTQTISFQLTKCLRQEHYYYYYYYYYYLLITIINEITNYHLKILEKYFPGGLAGFDRDGSPVLVELFGKYDMEGLMRSCTRSDLEKVKIFQCQEVIRLWQEQSAKVLSGDWHTSCPMHIFMSWRITL